ncbi:MAG: c-type cytochrome domain-containing protein [candidate division KSB1 bacterium]|nr:c-type cytochrome domain-containing protein [candidate division KSB1 bacterium]
MKSFWPGLVCLLLLLLMLSACKYTMALLPPGRDAPDRNVPVSFEHLVSPNFQANCAFNGCHGEQNAQVGLQLLSWETVVRGSEAGEVIIPYWPEQSLIMDMLTGRDQPQMPFNCAPLDSVLIDTFRLWIAEGAPRDDGTILYSEPGPRLIVPNWEDGWTSVISLDGLVISRLIQVAADDGSPPRPVHGVGDSESMYVAEENGSQIR